MIDRRAAVLSLFAAAAGVAPASAQSPAIGDIRVDLSPLRARGWGGAPLEVIGSNLRSGLRAAFADRLGGGAILVVRIDRIQLSGAAGGLEGRGSPFSGGDSGGQTDYMEGELLLVGRGNAIIAREPLLNAMSPVNSGSWWSEDGELKRLASLSLSYARWARWKLG